MKFERYDLEWLLNQLEDDCGHANYPECGCKLSDEIFDTSVGADNRMRRVCLSNTGQKLLDFLNRWGEDK